MQIASSAKRTCSELRSASLYTATVRMPSSLHALITRNAISPRLATRTLRNMHDLANQSQRPCPAVEGGTNLFSFEDQFQSASPHPQTTATQRLIGKMLQSTGCAQETLWPNLYRPQTKRPRRSR